MRRLVSLVGTDHVLTDDDLVAGYSIDWTGRFRGRASAVVRPGSADEVGDVLQVCRDGAVAVVAQGGNTGLVGGSVPLQGEIVLSLRRLDALGEVDRLAGQVTVGAGTTLGALQAHLEHTEFEFAVDLAARDSATIGGMIATNAGGTRVVRYGSMRAHVLGVEAVFPDGRVASHLGGLLKDNTGYDLAGLLTGSEGTLGVVTAARLRLVPRHRERVVALMALPGMREAVETTAMLRAGVGSLDSVEIVLADALELVCEKHELPAPFSPTPGALLLIECADHVDPAPTLAAALGDKWPNVVGESPADRKRLWRYRDLVSDAINRVGVPHKLDVTLPADKLAPFTDAVVTLVRSVVADASVYIFGHVGDGNLHVNVVGAEPDDERIDDAVLRLTAGFGGSISAEHGVGTAKKRWLPLVRSEAELATFRAIKRALDSTNILNPNVLF